VVRSPAGRSGPGRRPGAIHDPADRGGVRAADAAGESERLEFKASARWDGKLGRIVRITIGAPGEKGRGMGFDQSHAPMAIVMTPEEALRAAGKHT